ncbi:MAG: autotransporter outer membrane beta-barrel domain-containing protein, partial [Helicobacter sp.]|nr:autotransporter outer membrane beta-barrel domain-containing protein [Helicobacter sp.]
EVILHLTNKQSFLEGRFSLQGQANAELLLDNGGKWFLLADSGVRTLNTFNNLKDIQNQYGDIDQVSVVDFIKLADDGRSNRLTKGDAFKKRTLQVHTALNGTNGVFRLMADLPKGEADLINVTGSLNGIQYIQIYQNGKRIGLDTRGKKIKVAHATQVNGDFIGLQSIAGIYNYTPILSKEPATNNGNGGAGSIDWYLTGLTREPNQTAKTLFNILSTPYRIYRLVGDSLNHRIDDLLYPPTRYGIWAKAYGGGIYQINEFDPNDVKELSQDLYYAFQAGLDYGENEDNLRYFYGGEIGYLSTAGNDAGYRGTSSSYSIGAYGGFINDDSLFVDTKLKYVFSYLNNKMNVVEKSVDFASNMLIADFRIGFSIYPFRNAKKRTIQIATRGDDGNYFYRNAKDVGYVRDKGFYIQPFVEIIPAVILGKEQNLLERISYYNINAKLDLSPAFVVKGGVTGTYRFDLDFYSLRARSKLAYAYDVNRGGRISLVDDANAPLRTSNDRSDHRILFGIGGDALYFNDSIKLFADFNTDLFGFTNAYWRFSGGIRYKFGQPIEKRKPALSYRPKSPRRKESFRELTSPYRNVRTPSTFKQQNHFVEQDSGYIR